jgi:hypothetical protein
MGGWRGTEDFGFWILDFGLDAGGMGLGDFYLRKYPILAPLLAKEGLGEGYPRLANA